MGENLSPLPTHGEVFADARDPGRSCRVSWHAADDVFVVSIWHGNVCAATFRLARQDLATFMSTFLRPLSDGPTAVPATA